MTISIISCQPPDDLIIALGSLTINKKESTESYGRRTCHLLFPNPDAAYKRIYALMEKCLPLLATFKQNSQLSLRRVFAIMLYAKLQSAHPVYRKKDSLIKKSLIVDKDALYILNVGRVGESSTRRLIQAIRVPYDENKKATIIYRLVNRGPATLSACELEERQNQSLALCTSKMWPDAPKVISAYSYVSTHKKTCAFIKAKKFLSLFNPWQDRHTKWTASANSWNKYVEKGDVDSVEYLLSHFTPSPAWRCEDLMRLAADRKHYAVLLQLLQRHTPKEPATLFAVLPEKIETEQEQAVIRAIVDRYQDREKLFTLLCPKFTTPQEVQFLLSLGNIPQSCLIKALGYVETLEACALLASQIVDLHTHGGAALEHASFWGGWEVVFFIIAQGVGVNTSVDDDGVTPLFHAASRRETEASLEVIKKLLTLGADPAILCDEYPVIYWAAKKGNEQVVALLLAHSKNPEKDQALISLAKLDPDLSSDIEDESF